MIAASAADSDRGGRDHLESLPSSSGWSASKVSPRRAGFELVPPRWRMTTGTIFCAGRAYRKPSSRPAPTWCILRRRRPVLLLRHHQPAEGHPVRSVLHQFWRWPRVWGIRNWRAAGRQRLLLVGPMTIMSAPRSTGSTIAAPLFDADRPCGSSVPKGHPDERRPHQWARMQSSRVGPGRPEQPAPGHRAISSCSTPPSTPTGKCQPSAPLKP